MVRLYCAKSVNSNYLALKKKWDFKRRIAEGDKKAKDKMAEANMRLR